VIRRALAAVSTPMQHYHITLTTDLPSTPPVSIAPEQMTQVFVNLLLNAIEAVKERGQIHVVTQAETAQVVVMIIDDGPAIRPDDLPHIFEPFFTTKAGSTGLGLAVSHNLVQQHGGLLIVENLTNDRGVIMTVKLPMA
jgi:signal transduction histidine kinase